MSNFYRDIYNPDVLTCLANLSNDEVFTSPKIINQMLDMLPKEIWHDSTVTFLDPVCKSGVFLREIAKRLIEGLKKEIPNKKRWDSTGFYIKSVQLGDILIEKYKLPNDEECIAASINI